MADWHWLQFRVYESKTPGRRDRWGIAHLYPLGPGGELSGGLQLCSAFRPGFRPWSHERLVRHAPERARHCRDCLKLQEHARQSHDADLDNLARSLGTG